MADERLRASHEDRDRGVDLLRLAARAGSADATAETLCATALVTMRNIKLPRPSC